MTHPSVADGRCGHNYEPQNCPWDNCQFKLAIAERDALKAKLAASERERGALQKAHDLLNAGFESTCEQMHELKQTVRSLEAKLADSEAARLKAEAACASKDQALRFSKAAVWDGHYGGGVVKKYAQAVDSEVNAALSDDAGRGWHSPQEWEAVKAKMAAMREAIKSAINNAPGGTLAELNDRGFSTVEIRSTDWHKLIEATFTDAGQPILDYVAAARRLREAAWNLSEAVTAYTRVYGNDSCLVDVENSNVKMKDCIADVDAADAKLGGKQ